MQMHILSGGRLRMRRHIYVPDAARDDFIELPVMSFLFRHGSANVLFDTGCHPDVARDPQARWGDMAKAVVPIHDPEDHLINSLAAVGLAPEDIDVVVNSHLHCDHCGCNGFFSGATMFIHAEELAMARGPDAEGEGYFRADWDHGQPIRTVTGALDLFDDGRLVILPLPGHSPGLVGLLAGLPKTGAVLLTSDAVQIRDNLDRETIPKNSWNADLLLRSVAEIKRIEAAGTRVICGHDAAEWAALKTGAEAYD